MPCIEHISGWLNRAIWVRLSHVCARLFRRQAAGAALAAFVLVCAGTSLPALAVKENPIGTMPKVESNQPMLLQADEMIYDNQNNQVTARGNVEIYHGTYTLLADQVTYDRGSNTLIAEGNVRIKEPDGAVINADRMTLTDDFRDGFIRSLKIVTKEDARIAAARAIRDKGDTTVFEKATFTPCKICEDKPEKPPTWRIKAERVIHKKTEATISYRNATFELFGHPIAWFPYFRHADPSVKRKSGFLLPNFGQSSELGLYAEIPYYFALAPNYDFTFSPMFTEQRGVLLKGLWRHRTARGRYDLEVAGIFETDGSSVISSDGEFRGSIKTEGEFSINKYWNWGWDITTETDDTFRRFYKIDSVLVTDRISQVYLTGQRDRNYFSAKLYHFNGLLGTDTSASDSFVLPVVDYNYIFSQPVLGGELSFDTNVASLTRDGGADSTKLINQVKWRRTLIDARGQVITPFFSARGDVYYVSNVVDPVTGIIGDEQSIVRGMATAGIEYRYPFVKRTRNASHVMEPVAQILTRPKASSEQDIPNEDARSLVFDDTLLFDWDKFSGYDRIESGTRANVGVRYTIQRDNGGYLRAIVGQSYQIAGENDFVPQSGLDTTRSDYVAGLYIQPIGYFGFIAQSRFDEDSLDLKRTDLATDIHYGPFRGSLAYANLAAQPALGIPVDREEIIGYANLQITDHWALLGNFRYDIANNNRIQDLLGLRYSDDCFALTVSYSENFIRDRDIEPDERVMVRFELKYLGAFDIDAGALTGG